MKFAVIDTETSGIFDFRSPADAPHQPRLAQFAAVLLNEELHEAGRVLGLVKPDGWAMTAEASAVNGLTDEFLAENGAPVTDTLSSYADIIDQGYVIAAYNAQFDMKMMRGEMRRAGIDDRFEQSPNTCLMRACSVLKIPKASGKGGWPKLSDACAYFGIENPDEHDAMGDAIAAVGILRALHKMDALIEPKVHYAKNRPTPGEAA